MEDTQTQAAPVARRNRTNALEARAQAATHWSAWISLATLVLTLALTIGGAILFNEVRQTKAEMSNQQTDKTTADHETRIRGLETGSLRMEGKIDRIGDRLGLKFEPSH